MPSFKRTMAGTTAAASALLALMLPGTAHAASYPSAQIVLCNNAKVTLTATIAGRNQNNVHSTWRGSITPGKYASNGWWWKVGQKVKIATSDNISTLGISSTDKKTLYLS